MSEIRNALKIMRRVQNEGDRSSRRLALELGTLALSRSPLLHHQEEANGMGGGTRGIEYANWKGEEYRFDPCFLLVWSGCTTRGDEGETDYRRVAVTKMMMMMK